MDSHNRAKALLDIFRQGLSVYEQQQTRLMLDNRQNYIGMSDIGRYAECPRAALASKTLEIHSDNLSRLLIMQRGHWFEDGVGRSFAALGLHLLPQLEIRCRYHGTPIRAHLDYTLVWDTPTPAVRVLEVKSIEHLPPTPYPAHELQVQGQIGLLHRLWNKPVFSLRGPDGKMRYHNLTFPQICHSHFGLHLPKTAASLSMEGWLFCLSMKDATSFGPYVHEANRFEKVLTLAESFWTDLKNIEKGELHWTDAAYAKGFHPLCSFCQVNADCPKFRQGDNQPQWEAALVKLAALKAERGHMDKDIKEIEDALKLAHNLSDTQDWITTGSFRFRASTIAGKRTLNRSLLHDELSDIFRAVDMDDIDVNALLTRCEKEGAASTRLTVSPIHEEPKA